MEYISENGGILLSYHTYVCDTQAALLTSEVGQLFFIASVSTWTDASLLGEIVKSTLSSLSFPCSTVRLGS